MRSRLRRLFVELGVAGLVCSITVTHPTPRTEVPPVTAATAVLVSALIVTALRAYQGQVEAERNGNAGNAVAGLAMEYISGRLGHLAEAIDPERAAPVATWPGP